MSDDEDSDDDSSDDENVIDNARLTVQLEARIADREWLRRRRARATRARDAWVLDLEATRAARETARETAAETDPYAHVPIHVFEEIDAFMALRDEENAFRLAGEYGIELETLEEMEREPPTPYQNSQRAAVEARMRDQTPISVPPPRIEPTSISESNECIVCYSFARTMVMMPCRHLCLCSNCGNHESMTKCPICCATIEERINVFI